MSSPLVKENRVAAGLKAAIHNPNVSAEAKERAQERLDDMGLTGPSQNTHQQGSHPAHSVDGSGHETNRVLGGYKATLHSTCALCYCGATTC